MDITNLQPEVPATPQQPTEESSYIQKLVEQKGPSWSDPEIIAKGKLEADLFIEQLQTQLNELKEDLNKMDYSKQLIEMLKTPKATEEQPVTPPAAPPVVNTNDQQGDELKRLIEATVTQREVEQRGNQNLADAMGYLQNTFGDRAQEVLKEKATQLGLSPERVVEIAKESPNAFKNLIGTKPSVPHALTGTVRGEALGMNLGGERNSSYYSELRKTNPKQYYTAAVQRQKMTDAQRLGDDFFK